ncbi:glutathione S-transferase 3-like [Lithobates pipiens]
MCDKPVLHYFNGRGRAECIRWLLATAGVKFTEDFIDTKEQYDQLLKAGDLMFQQIPMLEIDGMKIISTKAIQNYIAGKYNLYGKDLKERALIDMYVDGNSDLMTLMLSMPFQKEEEKQKQRDLIKQRALNRYFPVFEKALENKKYLVGDKLSFADVSLVETILAVEEVHPDILQDFPNLQAFKARMSAIPTIKNFLEPGSPKKPVADETYVNTVKKVLSLSW